MYIYHMTIGMDLRKMSDIDIVKYKRNILLYTAYLYFGDYDNPHMGEFYAQRACEQWTLNDFQQRTLREIRFLAWARFSRSK